MNSLETFIDSLAPIPKEDKFQMLSIIKEKQISAGENFVSAGEFSSSLAYVRQGLFRYYYCKDEGIEFTKGFFSENNILISYSAILQQRESYFSIQALENSTIQYINYTKVVEHFSERHWFKDFLIVMLQKGYCTKEEREQEFLLFDAGKRYEIFLKRFPGLEKRVKQNIIASYLGIAPESLSRLRKKQGS